MFFLQRNKGKIKLQDETDIRLLHITNIIFKVNDNCYFIFFCGIVLKEGLVNYDLAYLAHS